MAGSIIAYETQAGKRWMVRYRKANKKSTDKRGFRTKREATQFLASVTVTKATGDYIDPAQAKLTVAQLAPTWLAGKRGLKPSAYALLPAAWRLHVEPVWGSREIGTIVPSEVQAWVTSLTVPAPGKKAKSATVALRALGVFAGILDDAVKDRRISRNPARGLTNLPRKPKKKLGRTYLTHDQLHTLAHASARPELVLLLGYAGLRWGEAIALRVRHVNMLRRRVHVEENAVLVDGEIKVGSPKSWEERAVPFPKFLAKSLAKLCEGKRPDDLLFPGADGDYLKQPRFGDGWFEGAIKRVQAAEQKVNEAAAPPGAEPAPITFPRITPHDLRHTAASLAVAAGANVKALQRMLGHASAAMTLDTYADLFDDDLDAVAERLEKAAREQSVGKVWALA